jgi:hypothetical protein
MISVIRGMTDCSAGPVGGRRRKMSGVALMVYVGATTVFPSLNRAGNCPGRCGPVEIDMTANYWCFAVYEARRAVAEALEYRENAGRLQVSAMMSFRHGF